jgi:hypothetical protein
MHEAPACGREGRRTVALVGDHAPGPWASTSGSLIRVKCRFGQAEVMYRHDSATELRPPRTDCEK